MGKGCLPVVTVTAKSLPHWISNSSITSRRSGPSATFSPIILTIGGVDSATIDLLNANAGRITVQWGERLISLCDAGNRGIVAPWPPNDVIMRPQPPVLDLYGRRSQRLPEPA